MEQALRMRDGVAIVSVLFDVAAEDNAELRPIVQKLSSIRFKVCAVWGRGGSRSDCEVRWPKA